MGFDTNYNFHIGKMNKQIKDDDKKCKEITIFLERQGWADGFADLDMETMKVYNALKHFFDDYSTVDCIRYYFSGYLSGKELSDNVSEYYNEDGELIKDTPSIMVDAEAAIDILQKEGIEINFDCTIEM